MIESSNSKPTLLEDQRKEREEGTIMNEREAFYHGTSYTDFISGCCALSYWLLYMLTIAVMTAMQIHGGCWANSWIARKSVLCAL